MMSYAMEGIIYLCAGITIIALYLRKKQMVDLLERKRIPEIEDAVFRELKESLQVSYERMLYLGISFLLLSATTFTGRFFDLKAILIIVSILLFLYNIPPRNRVMKILVSSGIEMKNLKERSIRL